jgi:hypothetical protein
MKEGRIPEDDLNMKLKVKHPRKIKLKMVTTG